MWLESDEVSITSVIEYIFFLFPTVICAPRYDGQFRSYDFWKLNRAAETPLWTELIVLGNQNF
jgi:hypothetical protein